MIVIIFALKRLQLTLSLYECLFIGIWQNMTAPVPSFILDPPLRRMFATSKVKKRWTCNQLLYYIYLKYSDLLLCPRFQDEQLEKSVVLQLPVVSAHYFLMNLSKIFKG